MRAQSQPLEGAVLVCASAQTIRRVLAQEHRGLAEE